MLCINGLRCSLSRFLRQKYPTDTQCRVLWCHTTCVAGRVRPTYPSGNVQSYLKWGYCSYICCTELNWTLLLRGNMAKVFTNHLFFLFCMCPPLRFLYWNAFDTTITPGLGSCGALTIISWKDLVTMKAVLQLARTQTALANPLTLIGKTSDMISHGTGPQPRAKPEHDSKLLIAKRSFCSLADDTKIWLCDSLVPVSFDIRDETCQTITCAYFT